MPYEPRKRSKISLKILIPALLAVFVLVYFAFSNLNKEEIEMYQIGNLTHEQTKEVLEKQAQNIYTISDYFFYGESLNLLHDTYNPEANDAIYGRSVILKDLTSENEYSFVIGTSVDSAININNLAEGFYEIYIVEDLIEKKAVLDEEVNVSIKTTLHESHRHEITLLASQEYFKERNISTKENYIYLQVKETSLAKDEYDIALDPSALDRDFNIWATNYGSEDNGLLEYEESYKAAELLKSALEEKGYKVLIVRGKEEELNSYGEDGRLQRAYNAKCKYYLRLSFAEDTYNYGYHGFDIAYSAQSSNMFANQIIYYMKRNSDMTISSIYSIGDNKGVYSCLVLEGMDGRSVYDSNLWIRESGGKATLAGMYSENAQEGTAFFAKDNIYGMNALDINLGYITSKEDTNFWKNNKEEYMQDFAEAISTYLNSAN